MITIEFLGPIQKDKISLEAETLNDVAKHLSQDEELRTWIDTCAVAVNDVMVMDLSTKLNSGDRVSLLPPVCGG
ncbi:MoaD/ThiS family protein [Sulfurimonas sp. MAG313]|nr:MoaD/ThiS family protein [Sulfurimonas sp. MAG313]MDF1880361.1 MoaD/ThiS family protein [Sulfurimonas sp. MAG313]